MVFPKGATAGPENSEKGPEMLWSESLGHPEKTILSWKAQALKKEQRAQAENAVFPQIATESKEAVTVLEEKYHRDLTQKAQDRNWGLGEGLGKWPWAGDAWVKRSDALAPVN